MKERILIALGDKSLSGLLVQKLNSSEYTTESAQNGREALEKMRTFNPDLVLIDTNLSEMNGYEVLNQKSFDKDITKIPVLIVSNSGSPLQMRDIPSTPVIKGFIVKSHIEPDEVLEKIEKVFGREIPQTPETPVKISDGKKILWVEDDKLLSTILSKKIESTGYKLFKANTGADAFRVLETEIPDIIILDILLPEMNGFDVLQKIKANENLRKIPVILLSNMSKQSDVEKAKLLGANRFIVKAAVSLDEIMREIEVILKGK